MIAFETSRFHPKKHLIKLCGAEFMIHSHFFFPFLLSQNLPFMLLFFTTKSFRSYFASWLLIRKTLQSIEIEKWSNRLWKIHKPRYINRQIRNYADNGFRLRKTRCFKWMGFVFRYVLFVSIVGKREIFVSKTSTLFPH